jgi:hypothetical protein
MSLRRVYDELAGTSWSLSKKKCAEIAKRVAGCVGQKVEKNLALSIFAVTNEVEKMDKLI